MDIFLVGGMGSLMDAVIDKLHSEGHRIYVLTEKRFQGGANRKVFEYYYFPYESDSLGEVFASVHPDVTICMGAFDAGFSWTDARQEAVRYSAGMTNLLMVYGMQRHGRLIYLSSEEVYGDSYQEDIPEEEPAKASGARAMVLAQVEQLCMSYNEQPGMDTVVLRLDHLYNTPKRKSDVTHIAGKMCLEALKTGTISANSKNRFSLLHQSDAVECIYRLVACKVHKRLLYHISSSLEMNEIELAQSIQSRLGNGVQIMDNTVGSGYRIVLSNRAFADEFGLPARHRPQAELGRMAKYMNDHQSVFCDSEDTGGGLLARLYRKFSFALGALIPFVENVICFIPFFMLNNRNVDSRYFAKMDFFLLYVLLFAIMYGQQQATFSAVLATVGYIFRQMYQRTGLEVMMDYNTYVWIAQLFILGLAVGYMRDRLTVLKKESRQETEYLEKQIRDIQDINASNARMKNLLANQLVNQTDSLGKVYEITSSLDRYEPEEVLFYAAEIIGRLMDSKDVAIYVVANRSFARLYSATSEQARKLGYSIDFTQMGDLSLALQEQQVFINKSLDPKYPMMSRAIYADDEVRQIIMVWGIPWERMTLAQADMLSVISHLIQNSVLKANRYLQALEDRRYIKNSYMLEEGAFNKLIEAYKRAGRKGLTQYVLLRIQAGQGDEKEREEWLRKHLRQSDYFGQRDGNMYVLLSNTNEDGAKVVANRLSQYGLASEVVRDSDL